jgi:tRNA pseudouridine38-40 synthase
VAEAGSWERALTLRVAPQVSLSRAARTDAGVHASGNVVSLKLSTELPDLVPEEELIGLSDEDQQKVKAAAFTKKINSFLPESIRMWGYMRVQNAFNARTCVLAPLPLLKKAESAKR